MRDSRDVKDVVEVKPKEGEKGQQVGEIDPYYPGQPTITGRPRLVLGPEDLHALGLVGDFVVEGPAEPTATRAERQARRILKMEDDLKDQITPPDPKPEIMTTAPEVVHPSPQSPPGYGFPPLGTAEVPTPGAKTEHLGHLGHHPENKPPEPPMRGGTR